MAAILSKMSRNHRDAPVMSQEEREEEFGEYHPVARRAHRTIRPLACTTPENLPTNNEIQVIDEPLYEPIERNSGKSVSLSISIRQTKRGRHPIIWFLLGTFSLVGVYTTFFLIVAGWISIGDLITYGPVHTTYTTATIGAKATIITSNTHGTIYITIINQADKSAKTYVGPALDTKSWNNDLNSVVATDVTTQEQGKIITIRLLGNVSYFHLFFVRPEMQFELISDKLAGYKVVLLP